MLDLRSLSVDIQGSRILREVSLEVGPGELVALVGRNGAGKTTTFKTVMGYLKPASGEVAFKGEPLTGLSTHRIVQRGIGYAPEESEVFGDLTVAENIELPTWTRPAGRPAEERIALAYRIFPKLERYKARGGMQLSGGERKMVSIARALALDPSLLLLDEPFEGLSPAIIPTIGEGIASIRSMGQAILIAESNIHHIPDFTDRMYVLERGEIIFAGSPEAARRNAEVMRIIAGAA
jgi:branched-chain amino acid transport system ATP-binding protein